MVEKGILTFANKIDKQLENRIPNRQSKLTYYQQRALKELRIRKDVHICESDKNLGPTASNKKQYKIQIYKEHLSTEAYRRLMEEEATNMNAETNKMIRNLFHEKRGLTKA
jgi:subtilase family serine protease